MKAWTIGRGPGRTECVFGGQEHEQGHRVAMGNSHYSCKGERKGPLALTIF